RLAVLFPAAGPVAGARRRLPMDAPGHPCAGERRGHRAVRARRQRREKEIQGQGRLNLPPLPGAAISGTMKKFLTPLFLIAALALLAGCSSSNNNTTAGVK